MVIVSEGKGRFNLFHQALTGSSTAKALLRATWAGWILSVALALPLVLVSTAALSIPWAVVPFPTLMPWLPVLRQSMPLTAVPLPVTVCWIASDPYAFVNQQCPAVPARAGSPPCI